MILVPLSLRIDYHALSRVPALVKEVGVGSPLNHPTIFPLSLLKTVIKPCRYNLLLGPRHTTFPSTAAALA